ncbi:Electron transfer flavoprotein alpha-subunit, partial [Lunasporangiospora selenospora]
MFALRRAVLPSLSMARGYATTGNVSTLLLVEHKDNKIAASTLNALSAASALGGPVTAIVAGNAPETVVGEVAKLNGVSKVLIAKDEAYAHPLPETTASLLVETQKKLGFTHLVASHSAFGKNVMPRAAALLDVAQISDITAVNSEDTFVRPIYA